MNLKFLVKLGKCPTEVLDALKVCREVVVFCTCVFEWDRQFKEGRGCMEDACARQLSTAKSDSDTTEVNELSGLLCLSGARSHGCLQINIF